MNSWSTFALRCQVIRFYDYIPIGGYKVFGLHVHLFRKGGGGWLCSAIELILPFVNISIFYHHVPMDWSSLWPYYNPILVRFVHWQSNFRMMSLCKNVVNCCVASCNFEIGPASFSAIYWMLRQARKQHRTWVQLVPAIWKKKNINTRFKCERGTSKDNHKNATQFKLNALQNM